jgi:formyl-CoA transferase
MIALRHAEATGQGQVIDISLFEPLFSVLEPQVANWRLTRKRKPRTGSRSTNTSPRNAYRTQDGGWVCLSASTQGMTEKLLRSIGQEALITDPRFAHHWWLHLCAQPCRKPRAFRQGRRHHRAHHGYRNAG